MSGNDLGLKLGNDDMVFWDRTIKQSEVNLENSKNDIKLFKLILKSAKREYAKAERKFKDASIQHTEGETLSSEEI